MSSFQAFGDLAASDLSNTVKAARHEFQTEAEGRIAHNVALRLELSKDNDLLDIGCGTGNITVPLVSQVKSMTVVDHVMVVKALVDRTIGTRVIYTYGGDFMSVRIPRYFDKILVYSVLHYLSDETEAMAFLQKAYGLLRPGGKMMLGDIPNIDRKERFEATLFGAAFSKAWAARLNGSNNKHFTAIAADENRVEFNDEMIRRLMKGLGARPKDYIVLPQPSILPFGFTREDIVITKPE